MKKWQLYILIFALIGVIIMMHNCQSEEEIEIEYVEGETLTDSIPYPVPIFFSTPSDPEYIYDTIRLPDTTKLEIDTMAIVQDWIKKREYKETLFDNDTLGEMTIDLSVQYNK